MSNDGVGQHDSILWKSFQDVRVQHEQISLDVAAWRTEYNGFFLVIGITY